MSNRAYAASKLVVALALLPASIASAGAADVTIADAKIAGGKLVITGTTASPNTWVRLDDQKGSDFNVKSGPDGAFSIGVVYHPGDCIVELQKLVSPTTLGAATAALVANCGPVGITPRGAWSAKAAYSPNDLVTHEGSSWRAKRDNAGGEPGAASVWELFAAKGDAADGAGDGSQTAAARRVPPTGAAGGDLTGTYPNPTIAANAVASAEIAPDTLTSADIATNAVGTAELADFAVVSGRLAPNAVNSSKIIDGSITGADIASDTLTAADIATNAVGTSELADNAVVAVRVASGAITSAKVLDDTQAGGGLTAADLRADSVGSQEIQTDAVQATEIADNSIDSGEIADNSLFADDLAANSVGNSELQDNAVASANIINSTITGADVANNSLTTADIDGASINGQVNLNNVPNGRCLQVNFSVPGSVVGEAVVIALNGAVQNGIILYPQRVSANGTVQANVCNFTGTTMNAIVDMPVKIITFN